MMMSTLMTTFFTSTFYLVLAVSVHNTGGNYSNWMLTIGKNKLMQGFSSQMLKKMKSLMTEALSLLKSKHHILKSQTQRIIQCLFQSSKIVEGSEWLYFQGGENNDIKFWFLISKSRLRTLWVLITPAREHPGTSTPWSSVEQVS